MRAHSIFITKKRRGFTLVELLVVIIVIAILATIAIISYNGAQSTARDNQRKADLQSIAQAYLIHYQDKKAWNFSVTELTDGGVTPPKENGGTNAAFFNYNTATDTSVVNIMTTLKYLPKALIDPNPHILPTVSPAGTHRYFERSTLVASQYLRFYCYESSTSTAPFGVALLAHLEKPSTPVGDGFASDTDPGLDKCLKIGTNQNVRAAAGVSWPRNFNYGIFVTN